jgi:dTDP-glucose pyrophosphorylase
MEYKKYILSESSTIRHALEVIDSGAMRIAFIVDSKLKLLGSVSDGDIRRALIKGFALNDSIKEIYNDSPLVFRLGEAKENILRIARQRNIYQIPITDLNGNIVDIEDLEYPGQTTRYSNQVIIMAGGLGARLSPLTDLTPKPMLNVGSKPILQTIIENFANYGYANITISLGYKSEVIENYFGDGHQLGVDISYMHESKKMGTAGSLSLMRKDIDESFFVMNADILTSVNFNHLHQFHKQHHGLATMAVREYEFQVPYGVVNEIDGKIISIIEKPTHKYFVNSGIYMLEPEVLKYVPEDGYFDMTSLFERIIASERANSFPIREYWMDIGHINDYHKANLDYDEIFK